MTSTWARWVENCSSTSQRDFSLLHTVLVLEPLSLLLNGYSRLLPLRVKQPKRKANHSLPFSVYVKNEWSYTSSSATTFMEYMVSNSTYVNMVHRPDTTLWRYITTDVLRPFSPIPNFPLAYARTVIITQTIHKLLWFSHRLNAKIWLQIFVIVKFTLQQAMKTRRRFIGLILSLTSALYGGGWSMPRPGRFTPGNETRCLFYRRLGGPQGRSRRVRKVSSPPEFDPMTVQTVASRFAIVAKWNLSQSYTIQTTGKTNW
jgi:hypothetical protein